MIKANEAKIIEYQHCFNQSFKYGDCMIENSWESILFSTAIFNARDTLGNQYPQKNQISKFNLSNLKIGSRRKQ